MRNHGLPTQNQLTLGKQIHILYISTLWKIPTRRKKTEFMLTHKDLGDNTRLAKGLEDKDEKTSDDNNQGKLKNKEREREIERIIALPNSIGGDHAWCITYYGSVHTIFLRCRHFLQLVSKLELIERFIVFNLQGCIHSHMWERKWIQSWWYSVSSSLLNESNNIISSLFLVFFLLLDQSQFVFRCLANRFLILKIKKIVH